MHRPARPTVRLPEMRLPQPLRHVIVLEGVQDPGNVGNVIRTANALGMDAVVLTGACADLYSPKTVRAAMGALFRQPVLTCTTDELQLLHARGLKLYGAALTDAAQDLRRVPPSPDAVAIGSEGRGLTRSCSHSATGRSSSPCSRGRSRSLQAPRRSSCGRSPAPGCEEARNTQLQYWVWLSMRWRAPEDEVALVEHFGTPRDVYFATEADYRVRVPLRPEELRLLLDKDLKDANRALAICDREHIRILTIQDAAYPQRLPQIYDPPLVLYVRGTLPQFDDRAAVAVVGTRSATPYGVRTARKFGFEIVRHGGIVL